MVGGTVGLVGIDGEVAGGGIGLGLGTTPPGRWPATSLVINASVKILKHVTRTMVLIRESPCSSVFSFID